ncbi:MAG: pilus assembly protein N-terminal domain-containing protein [Acidithiobacillus sp.]|jgi:pilus assembly protein CpaC|nr:pilus assembly protein N-terminal domain-containing protein [Acidithiobacillus sp.]
MNTHKNPSYLQPRLRSALKLALIGMLGALPLACLPSTALAAGWSAHSTGSYRALSIAVGTQQVLTLDESAYRVAIGNPKTASIRPLSNSHGKSFLITGISTGETSLLIWKLGHKSPEVWQLNINAQTPHAPLAAPAPGMPKITAQGNVVTLSGAVSSQMKQEAALEAAAAMAGKDGKIIDESTIPVDDEVQVGVKVVEFSKTELKNVGINIFSVNNGFTLGTFGPSTLTGPSTLGSALSGASAVLPFAQAFNLVAQVNNGSGLSSYLSLLEGNDILQVLAEPTLVAMNGHKASFLAGGEIPIPVPQSSGTGSPTITIQYKKYGVALDLTPTILSSHKIALHVAPSVSSLDYTNAITLNGYSVPALLVRQANTTVTLGNGESLIIGGLVDRQMQQNISKVPILGDLPILGAFFRSINYSKQDMELAIIVTPRLVRPIAAGTKLPALPGEKFAHSRLNLGKAVFLPGSHYDESSAGPGYTQ